MLLQGHVALITGSGRNIGASIAQSFAREGADIVVNVRSSVAEGEETVRAVRALGRKATLIVADVTDSRQVRAMAEQAAREFGVVDILVNSVGIAPMSKLLDTTDERWEQDRKSTRLNSSHTDISRMPSSA